jgi:glycosyltransferase involved in cell wall biosynthesis
MRILRVSNASEHTSAPLNSFTLARNRYYIDEEITYLSFFKNKEEAIDLYFQKFGEVGFSNRERLRFLQANGSIRVFWKFVVKWVSEIEKKGEKSIIHLHQPRSGFIAAAIARISTRKIPIIYTVHNNYKNYSFNHKIALFLNFIIVDKVTFVSNDAFNSFFKFRRFFKKKCVAIQNGVDVERIMSVIDNFKTESKVNSETIKFISTGRFTPQKNQFFLLDVLESYEGEWHLDIYGNGQFEKALLELIQLKGLNKRVSLKNTVPRDEILKAYSMADVYLSTALWEGLPVAVMEAMTVGLPCVVSDIPSHNELGVDLPGVSVVPFTIHEWHKKLDYWKKLNKSDRKLFGMENQKVINQNFTMRIMQQNYRELYEASILEKSK